MASDDKEIEYGQQILCGWERIEIGYGQHGRWTITEWCILLQFQKLGKLFR